MAELYALSLKQPWAALLIHGRKTIEVRRWPTARRGPVLIHAAQVPDSRPEAWAHVTSDLRTAAAQSGGIVGRGEIQECRTYRTRESFSRDQSAHLNEPSWFQEPELFGFIFKNAVSVPFHACKGQVRFFRVQEGSRQAGLSWLSCL